MSKLDNHRARKRFGQNFLHDNNVIQRIIRSIKPKNDQQLIEIGPGQGALTEHLLEYGCQLTAIELDKNLLPILTDKFGLKDNFRLLEGDALKFDFQSLYANERPIRIVGNLPYNISTPLIFHLLRLGPRVLDMHFMLQKEVVDRMASPPSQKSYGRLSVMTQYYCQVQPLFDVAPAAFHPAPKVTSSIVRLTPYQHPPHTADNVTNLESILRSAFSQRRKTLRNALKGIIDDAQFSSLEINPQRRPETLSIEEFIALSNSLPSDGCSP